MLRTSTDLWGLNLVGLFTTLAAALTAWTQVRRTEELRKSYALAANELLTIRGLLGGAATEAALSQLVRDTEAAISREHTLWVTKTGQLPAVSVED